MSKEKNKLWLAWGLNSVTVGIILYVLHFIPVKFWLCALGVIKAFGTGLAYTLVGLLILGVVFGWILFAIPTIHYVLKWLCWAFKYSFYFKEPDFPPQWTYKASWKALGNIVKYPIFWIPLVIVAVIFALIVLVMVIGGEAVFIRCSVVAVIFLVVGFLYIMEC